MSEALPAQRAEQLLSFFKLFSEVERIKIAGLLAQGPRSVEEIAASLSILRTDAVHHLARLSAAGLTAEVSPGVYQFNAKALEALAHGVLTGLKPATSLGDEDMAAFDRKVVADFSTGDGRLKGLPAQHKKQLAVLRYVNRTFKPGVQYTEKQVNEILARFHEDTAALRRSLVDNHFMARKAGIYWQVSEPPTEG